MRLLVIAHCGLSGHRGYSATLADLQQEFRWKYMVEDVKQFVQSCVHCIISRTGDRIPRPLGSAVHGSRPNEVVHFDFLYMGSRNDGFKYLLLIKDDISSYVWLCPTMNADAEAVADTLSRWIASFTVMDIWVSDQGSHFKNKVIKEMAEGFEVTHHFTTAYTPCANGTVERCCREVLRATSVLRSELRLGERDWPAGKNLVQRILNTAPLARLGKNRQGEVLSPVEVFTGQKPKRPISLALPVVDKDNLSVLSMKEKRAMQRVNISGLQAAIENIHKSTSVRVTKRRIEEINRHNQKTNIVPVSFEKGEFVLVRRAHKKGHKLSFKWVGPRRIVAIKSNWVYDVVDLVSGKQETVHASRLTPYRADWEGTDVPEKLLSYAEHSEAMYQDLLEILDIKKIHNAYWLLASWEGMESELDTTWEPLEQLYEDVPKMVSEYLKSVQSSKKKITEAATRRLGNNI